MSDPNAAPDPIDKAYVEAEAVLHDDQARAARRARILAAVASEPAAAPVAAPPPRRPAWARGRWLVAASVAGLGVLLATHVYLPTVTPQRTAPARPAHPAPAAEGISAPPAPAVAPPSPTPEPRTPEPRTPPAPRAAAIAPADEAPAYRSSPALAPAPQRPASEKAAAPAPPPAAAPAAGSELNEIVVTGERIAAPPASRRAEAVAASAGDRAGRLRDAAQSGLTADVQALLAKGASVDTPDADGETALMKAIQADHPDVAALLRRHGASLDHRNHAGQSARDMATAMGDAELNQALGLRP